MTLPPYVYHLAEAANWPLIQRDGLRSSAALLAQARVRGDERQRLGHAQRPTNVLLPSGATIRHQRPMPPTALVRCLVGMTPGEWYALLNSRVFFWLDPDRLNRQRSACAADPQVVMVIDTAKLIAAHARRIALTPINTGNARRRPARRSVATFVPYHQWMRTGWATESAALGTRPRGRTHPPAELTVSGAVPDVMKFVIRTCELAPGELFVT